MKSENQQLVKASDEADLYRQGRDWEAEREALYERSERRAWTIAGGACVLATAAVIGISFLAPFKRLVPYVFAVDKTTGNVELVSAADDRSVEPYRELLDKHWAKKYVTARESYNYKLLQGDYDTVLALSTDEVGRDYARLYDGPNARDKKYGASLEMSVNVLSVTIDRDAVGPKAVVRFEKTSKRTEAQSADAPQYFVATIAYEYKSSMFGKEKDLIMNPLGYKVTGYRVDSEIAPVSAAAAGASASAGK